MKAPAALITIKIIHTAVWAFFVACISAIPVTAHLGQFKLTACSIAAVLFEVVVLLVNRWNCPLTGVAARYTSAREDNFDIYLPLWLAKHNKLIFGWLFVAGLIYACILWFLDAS
jgi:hypothetical protein